MYWYQDHPNYCQGGEVDGPGRGGAPLPWDMEEPPANMFKEEVLTLLVMVMAKNIMIQLYVCSSCTFPNW